MAKANLLLEKFGSILKIDCVHPLNKSEMFYCNVETKIRYQNRTRGNHYSS